jgi:hypothetical protein
MEDAAPTRHLSADSCEHEFLFTPGQEGQRTHRVELSDYHLRQVGHVQSRGTGPRMRRFGPADLTNFAAQNFIVAP